MSNPTNFPPGGYVTPNSTPPKRGPGCWAWGLMTCLVVVIIFAVLFAAGLYKMSKTAQGRKLMGTFSSAVHSGQNMGACMQKMKAVRDAVVRYHDHTGKYPANLNALLPDYLASPATLHCDLDSVTDPKHVTFVYTKPKEGAPGSTPLLSFHWKYEIAVGDQSELSEMNVGMTLDGTTNTSQSQSSTHSGSMGTTTTTKSSSASSSSTTGSTTTTSVK